MPNIQDLRAALDRRTALEKAITRQGVMPITHNYLHYGQLLDAYRKADLAVHLIREALIAPKPDPQYDIEVIGL